MAEPVTPRYIASMASRENAFVEITPEALHAVYKGSRDVRHEKARAAFGYDYR